MKFWEKYGLSKTIQFFAGCLILLLMIILGASLWKPEVKSGLMFRMAIGLTIGYALARAAMGFAGTVNRSFNSGSTKLMKAIALCFIFGGVATFIAVAADGFDPMKGGFTNPLNHGLLIGATLFGFGMAFTTCCASGVLTDLAESPLKAIIVIFFFGMGIFLGTSLLKTPGMQWVNGGWFGIKALETGHNFTTWFKWDGMNGALGALILTIILASGIIVAANYYEKYRKAKGTYFMCESEKKYEELKNADSSNETLAYKLIAKPWSMTLGAAVIALAFGALVLTGNKGWGVSGPLGDWFVRFIHLLGVPASAIDTFSNGAYAGAFFEKPILATPMYVQDLSIFAGALIYLLMSGKFFQPKAWLFKPLEIVFIAFGGLCLGVAVKFARGCNAGGLYSPIAEFSVSGWIYLLCIIVGGFLGNMARKKLYKVTKLSE